MLGRLVATLHLIVDFNQGRHLGEACTRYHRIDDLS
jgi:hypothetical protein